MSYDVSYAKYVIALKNLRGFVDIIFSWALDNYSNSKIRKYSSISTILSNRQILGNFINYRKQESHSLKGTFSQKI